MRILKPLVVAFLFALAGCGPGLTVPTAVPVAGSPTPVAASGGMTAPATVTAVPTSTPAPTATVVAQTSSAESAALAAELAARLRGELTPAPDASAAGEPRIAGVEAQPLGPDKSGRELFLAHSYGLRSFKPEQPHFASVYARDAAGWAKVARVDLKDGPDYLDQKGASIVPIEPSRTWVALQGGAGAHAGVFSLLSFDGASLRVEVTHTTASPGADGVRDVDGDGRPEVVLDNGDYYVFCYACGVRLTDRGLMRWDGQKLVEVKLAPVSAGVPADVREPVERARTLAAAGLYKDAAQALAGIPAAKLTDPTAYWNAALIRLNAEARAEEAKNGPYPILGNVFYGDYVTALGVVRQYRPPDIFAETTPLIVGTVAEPSRGEVAKRLGEWTTAALRVQPDLAAAHFLRGWAGFLERPASRDWLPEIERAAQLDPKEPLYAESLAYLRTAPTVAPAPTQSVGLPNPAAVNCTQKGGKLQPTQGPNGEGALCVFPDGSQCEEWALYRGECAPGGAKPANPTPQPPPARIAFAPNATSAQVGGRLAAGETASYVLRALKGQTMKIELTPPDGSARFSVQGVDDGTPYVRTVVEVSSWQLELPATQDYIVRVVAGPSAAADYTLRVTVE